MDDVNRLPSPIDKLTREQLEIYAKELREQFTELRRVRRDLESRNQTLERKIRELSALNKLFQAHLLEQYEAQEAHQRIASSLAKTSQEFQTLVDKASKQRAEAALPPSDEEDGPQQNGPPGDIRP